MTIKYNPTDTKAAAPGALISAPSDIVMLFAPVLAGQAEAQLWRVDLDADNRVLGRELIMPRGADTIMVHTKRVYRGAVGRGAVRVALIHNHPGQDIARTNSDHILTDLMAMAGDTLGIPLFDHIIMTDGAYFSFREAGLLS